MNFRTIKFAYPLKHWIASIVLAPTLFAGTEFISHGNFEMKYSLFREVFTVVAASVAMGIVFSFPILILYIALFNLCLRYVRHAWLVKMMLNLFAIACAVLAIRFLFHSKLNDVLSYFAISIIVSSFFFPVKPDSIIEDRATSVS